MAEPYVGEIRMFTGNYAPDGWAICNGALLRVSDYQMLFSLIGTTYGGDGVTYFALPNLQENLPVGQGQGTGLTPRALGQLVGTATVTLTPGQLPAHTHAFNASTATANTPAPTNNLLAAPAPNTVKLFAAVDTSKNTTTMPADTVSATGLSQAHPNMMPSLSIEFIIATVGIYPDFP